MSNLVEGVIQKISARPWQNKTFYSFALSGQDGWFSLGVKHPPAEGTSVRFEFKTNKRGYKEVDGPIEIRTDGEAQTTPEAASFSGGNGVKKAKSPEEKGYWDRKEARDIRNDDLRELGATRNTAIAFIDLAIKHEAVKLPAGAAKREGFLWDLLDRYVNKLRGKTEEIEATNTPADTKNQGDSVTSSDTEADGYGWN